MIGRFLELALARKHEIALANDQHAWTFGELADRLHAYGEGLARSPQRPVIYALLRAGPDHVACFLASLSVDAVHVQLPSDIAPAELARCAALLAPDVVLFDEDCRLPALRRRYRAALPPSCRIVLAGMRAPSALADVRAQGHANQLPRSVRFARFDIAPDGSTRALLYAEASFVADQRQSALHFGKYEGRTLFCALTPSHSATSSIVLGHLWRGSGVVFASAGTPERQLEQLHACRAKGVLASERWFWQLLAHQGFRGEELPFVRELVLAQAPVSPGLIAALDAAFPRAALQLRYGIPESFGALCRARLDPNEARYRPGLLGMPLPGVEFAPLPAAGSDSWSEIRVRAPSLAIAYTDRLGEWELLADEEGFYGWGETAQRDTDGSILLGLPANGR